MAEYLSPGVYVEEISSIKPIEGVSTSTAGFVGVTQRGPVDGLPVLVTSFTDYRRRFGGYLAETWGDSRFLPYAVQQFFENGGQRVYIKRVPGDGALSSGADIPDGIVTRLRADLLPGATSATLNSLLGVSVGTNVTFTEVVSGVTLTETRAVTAYNPTTGSIIWAAALVNPYTAAGASAAARPAGAPTLRIDARDPGAWGDAIEVMFEYTNPVRAQLVSNVNISLLPIAAALAFAGAGPAPAPGTPTSATLGAGQGALVQVGDTVEFQIGSAREQRVLTGVAGDVISWAAPVIGNYSAGATVRLVTALRPGGSAAIPAAMAALLQPGDQVIISGGGQTETLTVDPLWGGASPVTFNPAGTRTFNEGATLRLGTIGVRAGDTTLRLSSARNFYVGSLIELDNGTNREYFTVDAINGTDLTLSGAAVNTYNIDQYVRVAEFRLTVRYVNLLEGINQTERFDGLSMNPLVADKYIVDVVEAGSTLIRVNDVAGPAVPFASPATPNGLWLALSGGDDGTAPLDDAFIGVDLGPGQRTGIQALGDIDQISIVAVPGKSSQTIVNALIGHCELLKDRFAVVDPPQSSTLQGVQDFRNQFDTLYAAVYYPWLLVRDPLLLTIQAMPPSGAMVGIYARTDIERGVHKAPANEDVRGILGVETVVNKREQDILNPTPVNINVIRDFRASGRGIRVWGARCMTSDTEWKYINVRRLFIFVEESLDEGSQWAVFESNADPLWARVRQSIRSFLLRVWHDGALMGIQEEEAFFVRCDRTTMTQDDIDNGRLIILVGIAPVKPAEFVIIRISQYTVESEAETAF